MGLVDALVVHASRRAASTDDVCADGSVERDQALQQLHRLIGGYLGLRPLTSTAAESTRLDGSS